MRTDYRTERATVMQTRHAAAVKRTIRMLQCRIAESERFYRWPALIDSWDEDIKVLQARLKDIQSKSSVE